MKEFTTKMSIIVSALFLAISFNFSVLGQNFETVETVKKGIFEKIHPKNTLEDPELKSADFPEIYKSTNGTYPQETHHYYWDATTIWMADFIFYTTYDSHAEILTQLIVMANTGDTTGRVINTYDNEGRLTESLVQSYYNGTWENSYRNVNTFDEHGNQLVFLGQVWQDSNWLTTYGYKYEYTYDANYNILEEVTQMWNSYNYNWENDYKDIYSYDANGYLIEHISQYWDYYTSSWMSDNKEIYTNNPLGVVIEAIALEWDEYTSMWVNYEKVIDIVWHNWTGDIYESELESYTALDWYNGVWENSWRVNITYDPYGGHIELEQAYYNGTWENSYRYSEMYDNHGNELGYTSEYWDYGTWYMDYGEKYLLTYSGMDLVERIYQYWNYEMEIYENSWKEEYSDFVSIDAIDENVLSSATIKIYPNPATEILKLEVENMAIENFSIEIVNVSGQRVYFRQYHQTDQFENGIDISDYTKGIYFVKVQNAQETIVGKVLIQ